ncbi:uncharacterized protein BDZ99DRAFT_305964 [Mytilinidion resinicola]|uniref:Uncharacterized protein n=1 Tax=Mytilinidion resinicola TaxID=574789 RepID=A0A6A6YMQ7_9PEZI|nr:uncharacterized protein BDZ99DRAFT_305964 [Mytilinidion resinicola]KAF2810162.1 hypothetical protein BDZ99DRAFT_305964 [Mytilinidion resinicola]
MESGTTNGASADNTSDSRVTGRATREMEALAHTGLPPSRPSCARGRDVVGKNLRLRATVIIAFTESHQVGARAKGRATSDGMEKTRQTGSVSAVLERSPQLWEPRRR